MMETDSVSSVLKRREAPRSRNVATATEARGPVLSAARLLHLYGIHMCSPRWDACGRHSRNKQGEPWSHAIMAQRLFCLLRSVRL